MGTNNSTLGDLSSHKHLNQLASPESISPNDPFWNQLLSLTFPIPQNSSEQHHLEESTSNICKNFAINNCRTGNLCSLIKVFQLRAAELETSAECQDSILTWQTYNALFIIRNLCKYFVENLTEEVVLDQFEAKPPDGIVGLPEGKLSLFNSLLEGLVTILVDVPIVDVTYAVHLECVNTLLSLMSLQMYNLVQASESRLYQCVLQGNCSTRAVKLVERLLQNYIKQMKYPAHLHADNAHGSMLSAVASGLWTVITLGMGGQRTSRPPEGETETPLASQSLLLLLVLVNQCYSDSALPNPYREAFFACGDNIPDGSSGPNLVTVDKMKVQVDFGELYKAVCLTLRDEHTMLNLYMLLHRVEAVKAFILSRTNIDHLVMPILKILYHTQEGSSHHMYMALIVILILSEDNWFSKAVHEMMLKNIVWFTERQIGEISLGGLIILILIRTIQYNMTRMRDQYLHTNCLAALANMSSQFTNLHPYVAQRLISLFALLVKKHTRAVNRVAEKASETNATAQNASESESSEAESDQVQELAVLEEVMRMTLEILNSCLTHSLHHNPNLIYTMLYQRSIFTQFKTHATFQDIIQNIDLVLSFFTTRLEQQGNSLTVSEVHAVIKQGAVQFRRDRLKKFPDLKFRYVEEEKPEEFFIPYVWSLVYHSSNLYFNPSRIQLFSLQSPS